MRGRDDTELFRQAHGFEERLIIHAKCALVGEKDLKAADPHPHDFAQLCFRLLVEPGDAHVEREIAGTPPHPAVAPVVKGGQ